MILDVAKVDSPVGEVSFAVNQDILCALTFSDAWPRQLRQLRKRFGNFECRDSTDPAGIGTRLRRYFGGDIRAIDDIRVETGGTQFQRQVWSTLPSIRAGQTLSYRDVAHAIGNPSAVRAVGAANGSNPIWIVIPCHRVIAADGGLGGYGGGLERKRWLLHHEGAMLV